MALKLPDVIARNKGPALAVGVGGAAALFVILKAKASGSSTAAVTPAAGTAANPATLNSTATDLSAVTSNWSQDLSNQLSQNTTSINDALTANQANVATSTKAAQDAAAAAQKAVSSIPVQKPAPAALPKLYYTGTKASNDNTLAAISRKFGISLPTLRKLNPKLVGKTIKTGQKVLL